jgi:hypothetical protein
VVEDAVAVDEVEQPGLEGMAVDVALDEVSVWPVAA